MIERRKEVICPKCGTVMEFATKITPLPEGTGIAGLIYRCPTRKNEGGCGYIKEVLLIFTSKDQEIFV